MLPLKTIREPRRKSRPKRAERAIELLGALASSSSSGPRLRWTVWEELHARMSAILSPEMLHDFQRHREIAPQICGGGGETYLARLEEVCGVQARRFMLSTYRETLCGNPQDLTCVDGCYITRTAMRHLYHAAVLHGFCRNYFGARLDIAEVGGGFGNLARLCLEYSLADRYFIVDYSANLAIQYYYLTEFLPEAEIAVRKGGDYLAGDADARVILLRPDDLAFLSETLSRPSMLVSTMAMTEIPEAGQSFYLDNLDPTAIYIYGQTRNLHLAQGRPLSEHEPLSNLGLFHRLSELCHPVHFRRGDYYSELLGIVVK